MQIRILLPPERAWDSFWLRDRERTEEGDAGGKFTLLSSCIVVFVGRVSSLRPKAEDKKKFREMSG